MSSEVERRDRRRRRTTWILTSLVLAGCAAFLVIAVIVSNSWWAQDDPAPSADQQAPNGTSVFTPAGVDYLTRSGVARIDVRPDSLTAAEQGLASDGVQQVATRVPVRVELVAPDGEISVGLVSEMEFETAGDRLRSVRIVSGASGTWTRAISGLEHSAQQWGWPASEVARVRDEITAAAGTAEGTVTNSLPRIEVAGIMMSAEIVLDLDAPRTTVTYSVDPETAR